MRKIIRILLFLVCLEIFLRIGGLVTLGIQDYQNHFDPTAAHHYRILCIGESMTMEGGDQSYPRQLEEALNQGHLNKKFQVINKGLSGANTDDIMRSLDIFLNQYKPDMVIAMMGISDASYQPFLVETRKNGQDFFSSNKFLYDLRVAKLIRGVLKNVASHFTQELHLPQADNPAQAGVSAHLNPSIYDEQPDFSIGASDDNTALALQLGIMRYLAGDYEHAELIFRILSESPKAKMHNSKVTFYHYLALTLFQEGKVNDLMPVMEKVPFWNWYDIALINYCNTQENADVEISSFKKLHAQFPAIPFYSDMIYRCYDKIGNAKEASQWKEAAQEAKESRVYIKTKSNYIKLLEILKDRNIVPVLMQYPLRDLGSLKEMVQSAAGNEGIIFVDNEKNFAEAVKAQGYDAIFSDYYAGDFGHPTPQGNRILALHLAQTLIKAMNWK